MLPMPTVQYVLIMNVEVGGGGGGGGGGEEEVES